MQFFTDIDIQTKILHVGYSILGMLVGMVVLVKFKPPLVPRMVIAVLLGFGLVYCLTATGRSEYVTSIANLGWFALGLLFGIGRGEFIIEYIAVRFLGASIPGEDEGQIKPAPAGEGEGKAQLEAEASALPAANSEGEGRPDFEGETKTLAVPKELGEEKPTI